MLPSTAGITAAFSSPERKDMTMADDANEGSAAMLGSAAKCRPIGAYVHTPTYDDLVAEIARLRLTASEREALRVSVLEMTDHTVYGFGHGYRVAEALQSILDRLG